MKTRPIIQSVGALALSAGLVVAVPLFGGGAAHAGSTGASGAAGASGTKGSAATGARFLQAQKTLETQLANRQSQLARLSADVTASKTLSASDAATLTSRLQSETSAIAALAAKVPSDTTFKELALDRQSMLKQNRVYAVMTPQVIEVIEADSVSAQVTMLQGDESALQSEVSSILGQPGYKTAAAHYQNYVARVGLAAKYAADVSTTVMAQMPADWPGDTHVFVRANKALLSAQVAIAYADYDASVVGLATGGYTGS